MRHIIPIFLLLILATAVSAELVPDISLVAPKGGQTIAGTERFSFSVGTGAVIDTCNLLVNDTITKTARYDDVLKGRTMSFAMIPDEGTYNWTVWCNTTTGASITAPAEAFTIKHPEDPVKVEASGTLRGSLVHIFKMKNTEDQEPIVVPKIATGDFIEVSLLIPPSAVKKELYVRQRSIVNGTPTLWLTYKEENYYVTKGKNTTINMSQNAHVIATFADIVNNRATVIFYPVPGRSETLPAEANETSANETEPTVKPVPATSPATPPAKGAPEEKPGLMKRFFSWLSNVFG